MMNKKIYFARKLMFVQAANYHRVVIAEKIVNE